MDHRDLLSACAKPNSSGGLGQECKRQYYKSDQWKHTSKSPSHSMESRLNLRQDPLEIIDCPAFDPHEHGSSRLQMCSNRSLRNRIDRIHNRAWILPDLGYRSK